MISRLFLPLAGWPLLASLAGVGGSAAVRSADPQVATQASGITRGSGTVEAPAGAPVAVQGAPAAQHLLEIALQIRHGDKADPVAAAHVFANGDTVRLRLRSHYTGYLYVMDQGTSGHFATVFPSSVTGHDNRLLRDHDYLVPAGQDGWFEVGGPDGFDVLYFLLSPSALGEPTAANLVAPGPASSLRPRCNDKLFRARGECTDSNAGPATVPREVHLPAPLAPLAGNASRDITFVQKGDSVAVTGSAAGPVILSFRLAHALHPTP